MKMPQRPKMTTKPVAGMPPTTRLTRPKSKGSASVRIERESKSKAEMSISTPTPEQTGEVKVLSTNPKVLANLKAQVTPAAISEAMIPDTKKPKPVGKPPPNTRYVGSQVEKWDAALREGGTYLEIGAKVGKPPSLIRAHAKFRVKSGKWLLTENGDQVKLVAVAAASK
jgi:hypothetical protein